MSSGSPGGTTSGLYFGPSFPHGERILHLDLREEKTRLRWGEIVPESTRQSSADDRPSREKALDGLAISSEHPYIYTGIPEKWFVAEENIFSLPGILPTLWLASITRLSTLSSHFIAAAHMKHLSGDPVGLFRGEKDDGMSNIFRSADSPQWITLFQ